MAPKSLYPATSPTEEEDQQQSGIMNGMKRETTAPPSSSSSDSASSDDGNLCDVEIGTPPTTPTAKSKKDFVLRWSRLQKEVDVVPAAKGGIIGTRSISGGGSGSRMMMGGGGAGASASSGKKRHKKIILDQVSGYARAGEMLAVMGPSGSGKTSMMNTLSGRTSYQAGTISINGEPMLNQNSNNNAVATSGAADLNNNSSNGSNLMKRFMARVAYVKQQDIFFGHLSVQDQLTYTALLRMPATKTKQEKLEEVARIIRLLRLTKVAESPISLLSGGERKRVNIGTELLTDPLCLLLDEPTSGLDSTSAVGLVKLLQQLAKTEHKTVITTIHQPSSAVFRSFDRLMMLSEGHVVYFGTPTDSLLYLRRPEINLPCPEGYNGADHWMDLLVIDDSVDNGNAGVSGAIGADDKGLDDEEDVEAGATAPTGALRRRRQHAATVQHRQAQLSPRTILQDGWDNEAVAHEMDQALMVKNNNSKSHTAELTANNDPQQQQQQSSSWLADFGGTSKYNTGWFTQFKILTHRALKNTRSAIFTPLNLVKSVALGLVVGLLWFQTAYTEQNINDIRGYYFFTMTYWVFDAMFQALTAFPSERTVILKERASGSYRLSAYFLAKTTSDAPVRLILPLLYMVISFWMTGMDHRFEVFVGTIGCTLLSVMAGEALGLFIGAAVYDMQLAMTVMTVSTLALMLLGGFFVSNVPSWVAWAKYLSPFKYAFDSSLQVIFDRPVPCDGSGVFEACSNGSVSYISVPEVHDFIGIQGSVAFNVGLLLVFCFLPRYGAYLALRMKKGDDR